MIYLWLFYVLMEEVSNYDGGHIACKAWNIATEICLSLVCTKKKKKDAPEKQTFVCIFDYDIPVI